MISILDYGMGNTGSVSNVFSLLGEDVSITDDHEKISSSEAIILPGVGSFSDGMKNLEKKHLVGLLNELVIKKSKPYLGICLGLEFLAEKSYEGGETSGFSWIKGNVKKIEPANTSLKIPHMGWDDTEIIQNDGLLKELKNPAFYYLHSYYFDVDNSEKESITSICNYGDVPIISTIQKNNIYGVQFHPEKSQSIGIKLIKNFLDDIRD